MIYIRRVYKLPEKAQTVYERKSGPGEYKAFAYTDSGVLRCRVVLPELSEAARIMPKRRA